MRTPGRDKHTDTDDIEDRAFEFAAAIVRLVREHENEMPRPMSEALVRSGATIGSHILQANNGQSRRNFLSQMTSARKLSLEVSYWLKLLLVCGITTKTDVRPFLEVAHDLRVDLTTICAKARTQLETDKS
ncbi:MAG: four helix bundle protein [Candidatus Hydrogenedentes bacterium]|nr:four helix bundle protein [Candidatus Hydrogenedentota bacterium]